jgi:hypothetical protein
MNYEKLLVLLNTYFKTELIKIADKQNEKISYMLTKKKGLELRILLIKLDELNRDNFKRIKAESNYIINKKHNISQIISLNKAEKIARINFIIVDNRNEYSKELVNRNADALFARIEGILNIALCESDNTLYIPSHFGLSSFTKFNKLYKIILNCFTDHNES